MSMENVLMFTISVIMASVGLSLFIIILGMLIDFFKYFYFLKKREIIFINHDSYNFNQKSEFESFEHYLKFIKVTHKQLINILQDCTISLESKDYVKLIYKTNDNVLFWNNKRYETKISWSLLQIGITIDNEPMFYNISNGKILISLDTFSAPSLIDLELYEYQKGIN